MNEAAYIQTVNFDFNMENEAMAFELNSDWHSFYHSSFETVANRVFQKFNPPNRHLLIKRLELDLGEINKDDFYAKFPILLEQKLEEKLTALLYADPPQVSELNPAQLVFEAFTFYLVHGHFPGTNQPATHDICQLFRDVYKKSAPGMRHFLFLKGQFAPLRKRLACQLRTPELEILVDLINKTESTFIITYTRLLNSEQTYHEKMPDRADDRHYTVWYLVLSYLLTNQGSRFNRKEFVKQTLQGIALHFNLKYKQLLNFMVTVLEKTGLYFVKKPELQSILKELNMEENKEPGEWSEENILIHLPGNGNSSVWAEKIIEMMKKDRDFLTKQISKLKPDQLARLCELSESLPLPLFLRQAIENEITVSLDESANRDILRHLPTLREKENKSSIPEYLKAEYLRLLRQPLSRRKLIGQLNETQIARLVQLIEPSEAGFIIAYSQSLDRQKERNLLEGKAGGEFRQLKWEFIFAVLVEKQIPLFNQKGFVRSVLHLLAAHYALNLPDLLSFIYKGMLTNEFPLPSNLAEIIKELYFEEKEQTHQKQETDFFSKELQETYYAGLLLDFLQTGMVKNDHFRGKIYSLFQYLETYRKDLLLQLAETLKSGILITYNQSEPFQKELYRNFLLFVISNYQIQLPGGRNIKLFLDNLTDDRYRGISVKALKSMLLAILQNNYKLYERSWELLTEKTKDSGFLHSPELWTTSDLLILKFLSFYNQDRFKEFVLDRKEEIRQRLISGETLFYNFANLCNDQPPLTEILSEIWGADFLTIVEEAILKYFPDNKEQPLFLLQLIRSKVFTEKQKLLTKAFLIYATDLLHRKKNPLEQFFSVLTGSGIKKETIQKEAGRIIAAKKFGHSLQKEIVEIIEKRTKEAIRTPDQQNPEEYFMAWLTRRFGAKYSGEGFSFVPNSPVYDDFAFARFETVLVDHPELIVKHLETGTLSASKLCQWIKTAPVALQMRWLQTSAAPCHKIAIQETFTLIHWIRAYFKTNNLHLPESEIIRLLLDFSAGKYQNLGQHELFLFILKISMKNIDSAQHTAFLSEIQQKAGNKGADWQQKITVVQQKLKNEKQSLNHPEPSESSKKAVEETEEQSSETIYIHNAGLVLCSPFLPRLFSLLNLTTEGRFENVKNQKRAVLLLQYLVFNETYFPEHEMVLNKILCGFTTGTPIVPEIEISSPEKETLEKMLQGMIQNWRSIGNASPEGLRQSFLVREGKLEQKDDAWFLTVEQKGYDVLLDQLPWSYTPIKHPWMKKIVHVKWR